MSIHKKNENKNSNNNIFYIDSNIVTKTESTYIESCNCDVESTYMDKEFSSWITQHSLYDLQSAPRTRPTEELKGKPERGGRKTNAYTDKQHKKFGRENRKEAKKIARSKGNSNNVGKRRGSKGGGAAQLLGEGIAVYAMYTIAMDLNEANSQNDDYAKKSLKMSTQSPLILGLNETQIADVANFILQGEFTGSYNQEDTENLKSIATSIMKRNDVPIQK